MMISTVNSVIGAFSAFLGLAGSIRPLRLNQRPAEAVLPAFACATVLGSLCAGLSHAPNPLGYAVGVGVGASAAAALGVGAYNHTRPPRSSDDSSSPEITGGVVALVTGAVMGYFNPIELLTRFLF